MEKHRELFYVELDLFCLMYYIVVLYSCFNIRMKTTTELMRPSRGNMKRFQELKVTVIRFCLSVAVIKPGLVALRWWKRFLDLH